MFAVLQGVALGVQLEEKFVYNSYDKGMYHCFVSPTMSQLPI